MDLLILLVTRLLSRAFLLLLQATEDYAAAQEEVHPTVAFFLDA